jgi:hypothetical protein
MSKSDLTLIVGGANAPVDVFEPLLTSLSRKQRVERACSRTNYLRAAALLASEIVTLDKAELLARVAEKPDLWSTFVAELTRAKEYANELAAIIDNAEMRLAVALGIPIPLDDDAGGDAADDENGGIHPAAG